MTHVSRSQKAGMLQLEVVLQLGGIRYLDTWSYGIPRLLQIGG